MPTMKAVVCDRYGPPDVLRITEVPRPVPGPDEVLIRIRATTVNRSDCAFRAGTPQPYARLFTGLRRPRHRILGSELSGEVEAVGSAVTGFEPGDAVFGVKAWKFGAHAEYICMRESAALARKSAGVSFEEAAAAVASVLLLEIVISLAVNGLDATAVRDIGVLGLAVCLTGCKNQRLVLRG